MGPIYGHFFNDLVTRRLLLDTAWRVVGWIERCNFPNTDQQGEWLPGDVLAPTLRQVLGVMGRDAASVILASVDRFEAWADTRPEALDKLPRGIGPCASELRGAPLERIAQPYTLWMLQRTLDAHRALGEAERQQVDEALGGSGWEELLAYAPRHRLVKRGFELVFEGEE
jgi:hypothetical protein